ncbi:glycosyl transferase [Sphingomonas oleivorans]|uniref:Glycosyl transferase n=1 Tax=Sphingomonas oleivorans TaxID=1735121 RepID=A0A2T5FXK1_9SPHN|nr:glycosyltransferase [Sphingomonas oleivorans]PTQ10858.1 glycosyl transferase [Sphingomonas oleivorans]
MRGRVLIYVHDLRSSGVVRNALSIAARLALSHDVLLLSGHGAGLFSGELAQARFRHETLCTAERPAPGLWETAWRLRRTILAERPDAILSAGNRGHFAPWLASLGIPGLRRAYRISNAIDRDGDGTSFIRRMKAGLIANQADRLLLVGTATGRSPVFAPTLADGRAIIVPNGVDPVRARALGTAPSPHPWLDADIPVILSIGRLHAQKDFPTLIRAAAAVNRQRPIRLVILGGGSASLAAGLREIAAEEGLAESLLLAGETNNVFAWLARASAFALSSRWEGSSMALLEAMALNLPLVVSRSAGDAATVLRNGRDGMLAPAGDVDAFAAAILRQISADAIRPGDRIEAYGLERSLALSAAAIAELAEAKSAERRRRPISTPAPSA